MLITVHPDHVARAVLSWVDLIITVGVALEQTIARFSATLGEPPPAMPPTTLEAGEAIAWWRARSGQPFWFRSIPPHADRRRHLRKYAAGELGEDLSFYFRGPDGRLNLRAQNLQMFLQIADGVDDRTWMYHLRQGDYARWFRTVIKDEELAQAADRIAAMTQLPARESRAQLRAEVDARYTAAA